MRRLGKECEAIKVVDDQRGGPTSADCIAIVLLDSATKIPQAEEIRQGTYHYAESPAVSWYEFAEAIFKTIEENHRPRLIPCPTKGYPNRAVRPKNSSLSITKIKHELGAK